MKAGTLDDLKNVVKQEELYIGVKLLSEHIAHELGEVQQIIEYCGMTKKQEEVVAIGVVSLPTFMTFTVVCKDGQVTVHKDIR